MNPPPQVNMMEYLSAELPAPFLAPELVDKVAAMLAYFLETLAGRSLNQLKVPPPRPRPLPPGVDPRGGPNVCAGFAIASISGRISSSGFWISGQTHPQGKSKDTPAAYPLPARSSSTVWTLRCRTRRSTTSTTAF